jgi:hypothetical protein
MAAQKPIAELTLCQRGFSHVDFRMLNAAEAWKANPSISGNGSAPRCALMPGGRETRQPSRDCRKAPCCTSACDDSWCDRKNTVHSKPSQARTRRKSALLTRSPMARPSGSRSCSGSVQRRRLQTGDQLGAIREPIESGAGRRRHGVQEIDGGVLADEERCWT